MLAAGINEQQAHTAAVRVANNAAQAVAPLFLAGPQKGNRKRGTHKKLQVTFKSLESDLKVTFMLFHGWIPFCGSSFQGQ